MRVQFDARTQRAWSSTRICSTRVSNRWWTSPGEAALARRSVSDRRSRHLARNENSVWVLLGPAIFSVEEESWLKSREICREMISIGDTGAPGEIDRRSANLVPRLFIYENYTEFLPDWTLLQRCILGFLPAVSRIKWGNIEVRGKQEWSLSHRVRF